MRVDDAGHGHDLVQRHVDHLAVPPCHHAAGAALGHQIDRMHPQRRAEQAILGIGHAAALHVAQHRDPRLGTGQRFSFAASQWPMPPARSTISASTPGGLRRLGHHHQREIAAGDAQLLHMRG